MVQNSRRIAQRTVNSSVATSTQRLRSARALTNVNLKINYMMKNYLKII